MIDDRKTLDKLVQDNIGCGVSCKLVKGDYDFKCHTKLACVKWQSVKSGLPRFVLVVIASESETKVTCNLVLFLKSAKIHAVHTKILSPIAVASHLLCLCVPLIL